MIANRGKGDEIKHSIIKGEFSVPEFISAPLRSLIEHMLQYNGPKRIQVKDVLKHKWFAKYF